jgi:hypothetical protein
MIASEREYIPLSRLSLKGRWSGYLFPISAFPAPEAELDPARKFVGKVASLLAKNKADEVETFIQLTQLHLGDGAQRVSSRGREWMPVMGLGSWPDREPPHGWTNEELHSLVPGEKLRPMMDIVLHLTSAGKGDNARDTMLGLGTILQFFVSTGRDKFLNTARNLLLPPIKDPSYVSFPFYVPLLEGKSIANADDAQLESWLCGAHACIRESAEDKGILIFASEPLEELLRQAGAEKPASQNDPWRVPR